MRNSVFSGWKKYRNVKLALGDQLNQRAYLHSKPLLIHFEINDRCNLQCIMCGRRSDSIPRDTGELDPGLIKRIAPWLVYAKYVGLAGNGEPFLHPQLFEILEILHESNTVPSLVTNGTLLTRECLERLMGIGASILTVSFDGGSKETFESIRVGARFDQILDSLEMLSRMKREKNSPFPVVNFLVCIQEKNKHELKEILHHAKRLGVPKVDFQTLFPFTDEGREYRIRDLGEIHRIFAPVFETSQTLGIEASLSPLAFGLQERLQYEGREFTPGLPLFCENIWQTLHVDVKGNVRFCCFWIGSCLGNLSDKTIPELWNHPDFIALRDKIAKGIIPEQCAHCHALEIHNPEKIHSQYRIRMKHQND